MLTSTALIDFSAAAANAVRYVVLLPRHVTSRGHLVAVLPVSGAPEAALFRVSGTVLTLQEVGRRNAGGSRSGKEPLRAL